MNYSNFQIIVNRISTLFVDNISQVFSFATLTHFAHVTILIYMTARPTYTFSAAHMEVISICQFIFGHIQFCRQCLDVVI